MVLLLRLSSNVINEFDNVNNPEPEIGISTFIAYQRRAILIDQVTIINFRKANTLNVTPEMTLVTIKGFIIVAYFILKYTTIALDWSRVCFHLATNNNGYGYFLSAISPESS